MAERNRNTGGSIDGRNNEAFDSQVNKGGGLNVVLMDDMAMMVDEPTASLTYQGWADPGTSTASALWRIRKVEKVGTETTINWADGDTRFDNIWDNRGSLSYV